MSIDRCNRCDAFIDTDFDLECYVPDPRYSLKNHPDICVCERCREELDREPPRMPRDWVPTPEQQAIMDRETSEAEEEE